MAGGSTTHNNSNSNSDDSNNNNSDNSNNNSNNSNNNPNINNPENKQLPVDVRNFRHLLLTTLKRGTFSIPDIWYVCYSAKTKPTMYYVEDLVHKAVQFNVIRKTQQFSMRMEELYELTELE